MLACDVRDAWAQFIAFVKTRCSVTAFGNWLAPIRVVESSTEEIVLEVPNIFVQEYLISNYKKDLCAFLPVNSLGEPAITFVVAPTPKKVISTLVTAPKVETSTVNDGASYLDLKLNAHYRFENFIEGPSNQFVKSVAMAVANRPGQVYNPLVIHGGVGLGKTHILHSIGHHIRENNKKLRVQCITTEAFINDLVDCLRNKSVDRMKRFYRSEIDVLLVDDFQFLQNRLNFEEELPYSFQDEAIQKAFALFHSFTHIILTSKSTVSLLYQFLNLAHIPLYQWQNKQTIVVGQVTAAHLQKIGINPNYLAKNETAEGVVEILKTLASAQTYFFFPHSNLARPIIKNYLDTHSIQNYSCSFYTTDVCIPDVLPDLQQFDEVVFTSPSTVDAFLKVFGRFPKHLTLTSIGPITENYLKKQQTVHLSH